MTPTPTVLDAGVPIAAEFRGEGSGPSLVLLHGGGFTLRSWDLVLEQLPRTDILAVDLPGHGWSGDVVDWSFEVLGRYVADAIRAAGVHDPVIVGWSLGWPIALVAAQLLPSVRGLVSVDGSVAAYEMEIAPFFDSTQSYLDAVQSTATDVVAADDDELERLLIADPLWPEWEGELRRRWLRRPDGSWLRRPTSAANVALVERNLAFDVAGWWSSSQCRVEYLLATQHQAAVLDLHRRAAAERSAVHRGTSVVEVDGPHDLPIRRPDELARLLLRFAAAL